MGKRSYQGLLRVFAKSVFSRRWASLLRIGAAGCLLMAVAPAAVRAQAEAHFSGVEITLGSGFNGPTGVAVDRGGNAYVADYFNNAVKEIPYRCASSSCILTLGGGFNYPQGVAVDGSGNVYVADYSNNAVKEMPSGCTASSCVTALGGNFVRPSGVAVDVSGNVYVAYGGLNPSVASVVEMPPGCTADKYMDGACSATKLGGPFKNPASVAVDASGNVYVSDPTAQQVYEMTPDCASSSCVKTLGGGFNFPDGVAVDASGNVYVADGSNSAVYEMPAGCGSAGCVTRLWSGFKQPQGVAVDMDSNVYVADSSSNLVQQISRISVPFNAVSVGGNSKTTLTFIFDSAGTIGAPEVLTQGAAGLDFADARTGSCTANGTGHRYNAGDTCTVDVAFAPRSAGARNGAVELVSSSGAIIATVYANGTGIGQQIAFDPGPQITPGGGFSGPWDVAVDGAGNLYIADTGNGAVKKAPAGCTASSCVTTLVSGLYLPTGVALDGAGNLYFSGNNEVEMIPPGCASSACAIVLGGGFSFPQGVAVDASGNVYVADYNSNAVTKMPPGCTASSCVTALGGNFLSPSGVAVDASGNVYIADSGNHAVKEIPFGCTASSCVTTLSGGFGTPAAVAVDASGNLYVIDIDKNLVEEIPSGCADSSCRIQLGVGIRGPLGLALDAIGNVYLADSGNDEIMQIQRAIPPSLSFATTTVGDESSDSPQTVTVENIGTAPLTFPIPKTGSNPSITSSYSTSFTLGSGTTCPQVSSSSSKPATLDAGTSCELSIEFIPQALGNLTGSVTLTDNAFPVTQTISLSGTGKVQLGSSGGGSSFTLTDTGAASQTVQPGAAATYTLQLAPSSGSYPGSVTFSATGLPAGATATFSPATLAANSGRQTVTLTVKTASSSAKKSSSFEAEASFALALLLLPVLGLRQARRGVLLVLIVAASFSGLAALSGCGGSTQPPPANYIITVTATSGQVTQTLNLQLEVQ
jgi:sugar lactone lactonase YvrE